MKDIRSIISFEDIHPFVRLAGSYPHAKIGNIWKKAYDCRLTYICAGEGTIELEDTSYPFSPDDLFYWLPGTRYRMLSCDRSPMEIMNICFDFTQKKRHIKFLPPMSVEEFDSRQITEIPYFRDISCFNAPFYAPDFSQSQGLFKDITEEFRVQKKYSVQRAGGILLSLLGLIAREIHVDAAPIGRSSQAVDSLIEYIHQHYAQNLNNQELAALFNFHPIHMNRLFHASTGISLHQYIINVRLSRATELLTGSGMSVAEAAEATGFKDPNYFSRLFKQKLGKSS